MEDTTGRLGRILASTKPEEMDQFLEDNREAFLEGESLFAQHMRMCIRKNGLQQNDVFLQADMSEYYGYKIISGEKKTRQRDTILRLCFGARMTLPQIQRALILYGMSPLYSRLPRDAVLIMAVHNEIYELAEINRLLLRNKMPPLKNTNKEK